MTRRTIIAWLMFIAAAFSQSAPAPSRISDLQWIVGSWVCDGQFVNSGKKISADLKFESVLDGKWILLQHDDRPPFRYHALSEWGWEPTAQQYVSVVQDSTGGVRVFRAQPGAEGKVTWDGGPLGSQEPAKERFEFERTSPSEFRVGYSLLKNGSWAKVDESMCRKK